jgi:hypothetical protein
MPGISHTKAYPGCPTLTHMIALRVTNPYEDADAAISFVGRKGIGKTTSALSFCEELANDIAQKRKRNESPDKFFNIDHVKSVTELGALELLSSGALTKENSVFLLDDAGTQWGARNFQSPINKTLNGILQICRIYKCVIVSTFIMQSHIDVQARGMTDFRAQMLYKNVYNQEAFFKFYYLEQGDYKGKSKEYKKFLTWHGKRITKWVIGKPSEKLENAYKKMRRENTDGFISEAKKRVEEIISERDGSVDNSKPTFTKKKDYTTLREKVLAIQNNPELPDKDKTINAMARKLKTSRYRVELAGDF